MGSRRTKQPPDPPARRLSDRRSTVARQQAASSLVSPVSPRGGFGDGREMLSRITRGCHLQWDAPRVRQAVVVVRHPEGPGSGRGPRPWPGRPLRVLAHEHLAGEASSAFARGPSRPPRRDHAPKVRAATRCCQRWVFPSRSRSPQLGEREATLAARGGSHPPIAHSRRSPVLGVACWLNRRSGHPPARSASWSEGKTSPSIRTRSRRPRASCVSPCRENRGSACWRSRAQL
jgi:hypothetical protein